VRILLVDDDPVFTELICANLREWGFDDITHAESAAAAIELVETQRVPYDCFLIDIEMEQMDGIELCAVLREREECRSTPMIMVTAGEAAQYMERAFKAGATDFMRKPLDPVELAGRINSAMLLVKTTKVERHSRAALRALISFASDFDLIDLGERVSFPDVNGMVDYYQIENRLLRMEKGLYPLSLFRVEIRDFVALFSRSERSNVLQHLQAISHVISETVNSRRFLMSYIGNGKFVICVMEHTDIVPQLMQTRLSDRVRQAISELPDGKANEMELELTALTSHRIQSSQTALEILTKEMASSRRSKKGTLPEIDIIEKEIFSQVEKEEMKQSRDR